MFNDSEAYMKSIANTCREEPVFNCPQCNEQLHTEWVDNGFGPYSVQASPYGCECGWHQEGCKECIKEKCFSWERCQGRALIKVNSLAERPAINTMKDPGTQQPGDELKKEDAQGEQATDQVAPASETAVGDSEEGSTEG